MQAKRPPDQAAFVVQRSSARDYFVLIVRLIGAVLLEQNDEWQLQHRYMQVEAMADLAAPASDAEPKQIPCAA